jgi:Holliday junction resolvase RusA-like endonuclease
MSLEGTIKFTLLGNTPSKKNSQSLVPAQKGKNGKKGRRGGIFSNKAYGKWYTLNFGVRKAVSRRQEWEDLRKVMDSWGKPFLMSMKFFRKSKHKFDYINLAQSVQDALVKAKIIEDDNCQVLCPLFEGYEIDKENPRCEVTIYEKSFVWSWV